jgi:hypothetical protein
MVFSGQDFDFGIDASENVGIENPEKHELLFGMKIDYILHILSDLQAEGYFQVKLAFEDATKSFIINDSILLMPMMINS